MDYVRSYHYLDDERYVARYLSAYQAGKADARCSLNWNERGFRGR